jgi:acetyltransferase-like isoleucine patch superfamily enzyme
MSSLQRKLMTMLSGLCFVSARASCLSSFVHKNAEIDDEVQIGTGTSIWQLVHLRKGAVIGSECVIGRGAFVDEGVKLGDRVKVQNYALLYSPAVIEDDVFIGPAVILTNDKYPRASNPDGSRKSANDWEHVSVIIRHGASIGARSVCVAPVEIGEFAFVGAGSVVVHDVPAFALVLGNPARQVGWVDHNGHRLIELEDGRFQSASLGTLFQNLDGNLVVVK